MTQESEPSTLAIVTAGEHKARIIAEQLPHHRVLWVRPRDPIEQDLVEDIPHVRHRSALVAAVKAHYWRASVEVPAVQIALFNDVIQYIPELDLTLERPNNYREWLYQALLQSGREICINAAHAAIALDTWDTEPRTHTVGVEARLRARAFTKMEVRDFAEHVGVERMMDSAGGLPVGLASSFFDDRRPVQIYFYPDGLQEDHHLIHEIQWNAVSATSLQHFATGAYRGPLQHLVAAVQ